MIMNAFSSYYAEEGADVIFTQITSHVRSINKEKLLTSGIYAIQLPNLLQYTQQGIMTPGAITIFSSFKLDNEWYFLALNPDSEVDTNVYIASLDHLEIFEEYI